MLDCLNAGWYIAQAQAERVGRSKTGHIRPYCMRFTSLSGSCKHVGGDGANYYVLNGILKYQENRPIPPLGVIPVGRGNSFAKDLKVLSVEDGIEAIIRQRTVPVDVCRFTQADDLFYFVNLLMAPEAQPDDGCFDAVILSPLSRLSLLATFPKIFKGTHVNHPAVRVVRGKCAVVRTAPPKALLPDGEIFGATPTTIHVLSRLMRYFA